MGFRSRMEKVYSLDSVIDFGKLHKGKSVYQVLCTNPSWLVWADNTLRWFKLHGDVWRAGLRSACHMESASRNVLWGERPY